MTDVDYDQEFLGEEPFGPRLPYIRLREVGDFAIGYVVFHDRYAPLYVFGTNERDFTQDGKPKTQDIFTLLLSGESRCEVVTPKSLGEPAKSEPVVAGMVAQLHIQSHNRFDKKRATSFIPVHQAHGRIRGGDVLTVRFDGKSSIGYNDRDLTIPRNVMAYELRKPRPDEAAFTAEANAKYRELRGNGTLVPSEPPAKAGAAAGAPTTTTEVQPPRADESDLF